nr:DUF1679 domain-containing protein [uncultured Glaciecola sp.]
MTSKVSDDKACNEQTHVDNSPDNLCDNNPLRFIESSFGDRNAVKMSSIQTLWSGYGEIARYFVPSIDNSVIVKIVTPQMQSNHPRGWDGMLSHQRKLDSYINESIFYKQYSPRTDSLCRTPLCYFSFTGEPSSSAQNEKNSVTSLLIMEDLDQAGFINRYHEASLNTVKLGIRWLAYFHAKFLNQALHNVWPVGTYWHLDTRPDEFTNMPESELKSKAHEIDNALNNARFQTLLHGDAKLANFCFSANGSDLAAVDFQYVGRGAGIKDVMYFLGSCLNESELALYADRLLDEYFSILKLAVEHYHVNTDFVALEAEWRELLPFAWADFERFLIGWASEHYKLNGFMKQQTNIALANC